tara:strand:- start:1414 stop:1710 length:297 start_codon:yes stop_codon:yes gene_type:complete
MDVSNLQINDESMRFIVRSLALEAHDFAISSDIPSHSVEHQLPLIFSILNSHSGNILDIRDVPTSDASSLAGISIRFSNEGYRLAASAAKDRVASVVN